MEAEATRMPAAPVSAQVVANAFVQQYYHILHQSPQLVHRFYQDISKLGRPETDGSLSITTTMQGINEKIVSLNYEDSRAEIKSVDAQDSYNGGFHVLVTGYLTEKDQSVRNFTQSFFLAPQDVGYFVLNDIFRYVNDVPVISVLVNDVMPIAPVPMSPPVPENHVSEQSTSLVEEVISEVHNPTETGHVETVDEEAPVAEVVDEEAPVAEVVDEVQDDSGMVVESGAKINEVPKKSYASIVMHLKNSVASLSPPQAAAKPPPKKMDQLKPSPTIATEGSVSSSEAVDNGNNPEGEADGYSIYVKGLPMSATDSMLEEVFKKFGTIKSDGIQVRSLRQQGFCFGFVEFEEASSVEQALEASPVLIGGRRAIVEEKRSTTNPRGSSSGRFQSGRGFGFRNEGGRGRGNYGGGRGYGRVEFNGRNEFVKRGNYQGGSSNRDGYQRPENVNGNGGRTNRVGGMANGSAKDTGHPVSATA